MGFFGPFELKTKSGKKFYLHVKETGKAKLYYFSKDLVGALGGVPHGYEVSTSPDRDLPFLRKTKGAAPKKKKGEEQQQQAAPVEQPPTSAPPEDG